MNAPKLPVRYREANESDVGFIFNSWLKSYRQSLFAKTISNTVYYTEHHKILEKIIKDPNNKVIIACNEEDPTQIYGYICAGALEGFLVIHYVYVKHSFRNMGIGKLLLNMFDHDPSTAGIYTHHTKSADKLSAKYNFVYHPYILFNESEGESNESEKEETSESSEN